MNSIKTRKISIFDDVSKQSTAECGRITPHSIHNSICLYALCHNYRLLYGKDTILSLIFHILLHNLCFFQLIVLPSSVLEAPPFPSYTSLQGPFESFFSCLDFAGSKPKSTLLYSNILSNGVRPMYPSVTF